ncbi:MAG TPA: hypothetical protein PK198_02690 [Saprospiraceae bacterium]|nr:hypothetical protein [Saprospiraceae bacterium]HRK80357.1 hypothetical protein [Saprospiraceae bacterium]
METKQEILEIVEKLPDEHLNELLEYPRRLEQSSFESTLVEKYLGVIISEDKEVLENLAK